MRLIKNGKALIDGELIKTDILLDDGKIIEIKDDIDCDCEVIDASGLTIIPGLVDVHVHLREPGHSEKETIKTGTKAAAHGGFTTICPMPNVIPFPDDVDVVRDYLKLMESESCVHCHPYACITKSESSKEVVDIEAISKLGVHIYSDDGVGVATSEIMSEAMKKAKDNDAMIVAHTEDMSYRKPGACVHDSKVNRDKGWLGIPSECESAQLIRDLELSHKIGNKYHACHISARQSVEALQKYKALGANVSGEVTAHHLLLEDVDVKGPNWKMNPPLRTHDDRMSLIEGLENGDLDFIANDHAPHTADEKKRTMGKAPFGIVSLETAFVLLYTEFVYHQKRWSLDQLVNWMALKPAKRFGFENIGKIQVGYQADLVLLDLEHESCIDIDTFESMGKNTPFNGWSTHARVVETIVSGNTVWKG